MSAYTTLHVSRRAALDALDELQGTKMDNETAGDLLDTYLREKTLYNFSVVPDDAAEDDDMLATLVRNR